MTGVVKGFLGPPERLATIGLRIVNRMAGPPARLGFDHIGAVTDMVSPCFLPFRGRPPMKLRDRLAGCGPHNLRAFKNGKYPLTRKKRFLYSDCQKQCLVNHFRLQIGDRLVLLDEPVNLDRVAVYLDQRPGKRCCPKTAFPWQGPVTRWASVSRPACPPRNSHEIQTFIAETLSQ